jgi:hypothetical protein
MWNTTGLTAGTYQTGVWALAPGSSNSYDAYGYDTFVLGTGSCISAGLSPNLAPPRAPGTAITFTASSNGCTSPLYEFWLLPPGGKWTVQQGGFNSTTTWNWNGAGVPGTYQVGVWVKAAGSPNAHDAYFIGTFQLVVATCTAVTIDASPASPQPPATPVTLTATPTRCTAPSYQFWVLVPPSTVWQKVGPPQSGTTYSWDTTGRSGAFRWGVWATQAGSTNSYDTYGQTTFWVGT